MHYVHHDVVCLTRKTIKLHTHSDSFRYAMQRKGGRTRSLVLLRGRQSTEKASRFFFQEPPQLFFPRVVFSPNKT